MATRAFTHETYGNGYRITWINLDSATSDVGSGFLDLDDSIRVVQVVGTIGGSTVTIQGSLDGGTTWATMHDDAGSDLAFTVVGIEQMIEGPCMFRPIITGGAGADLIVYVTYVRRGGHS